MQIRFLRQCIKEKTCRLCSKHLSGRWCKFYYIYMSLLHYAQFQWITYYDMHLSVWENESSLREYESASFFDVKPLCAYFDTQNSYGFVVNNNAVSNLSLLNGEWQKLWICAPLILVRFMASFTYMIGCHISFFVQSITCLSTNT